MSGRRKSDPITRDLKDGNARHGANVHIPAEAPPMPDYFNKSETLPAVWREIVVRFDQMSILALTDGPTVEAYCILVDQMRRMKEFLAVNGETYTADMKNGFRHLKRPEYDILKDTMLRLKTFAIEIGATPASRGKVPSLLQGDLFKGGKDGKNSWADFPSH
jgi:P27 family predicted phage terminase small subunit